VRSNAYLQEKCPRLKGGSVGCLLLATAVPAAPAAILGYLAVFSNGPVLAAAVAGALLLCALLWGLLALLDHRRFVHIYTYFEKPASGDQRRVSRATAFLGGEALARNLETLDMLAREAGVTPISGFGFADDFYGEELTWHAPEEGLTTVLTLLERVAEQPSRVDDAEAVTKDLKRVAGALEDARVFPTRFCFLVRTCNATNALEWERRKGTAF